MSELTRFKCEHGTDSVSECPMCMAEAEPRLTEKQLSDFRRQWHGKYINSLAQEVYDRRQAETGAEVRRRRQAMSSDRELEVHNLKEEIRLWRQGFEAALRWLDRDAGEDARGDYSLSGQSYSGEYLNDMADIRRARKSVKK